jgi:hypothetical protein
MLETGKRVRTSNAASVASVFHLANNKAIPCQNIDHHIPCFESKHYLHSLAVTRIRGNLYCLPILHKGTLLPNATFTYAASSPRDSSDGINLDSCSCQAMSISTSDCIRDGLQAMRANKSCSNEARQLLQMRNPDLESVTPGSVVPCRRQDVGNNELDCHYGLLHPKETAFNCRVEETLGKTTVRSIHQPVASMRKLSHKDQGPPNPRYDLFSAFFAARLIRSEPH